MKLTALNIGKLRPRPVPYPDHIVPGLMIKVGTRTRTWFYRPRANGGRDYARLGYFPTLGLADARTAARAAMERIESGVAAIAAPVVAPRNELSLAALIDKNETHCRKEGGSGRAFEGKFRAIRRGIAGFENVRAKAFSRADLRACRDRITEQGKMASARNFLAYLSPCLQWATEEELIETNICRDLRKTPPVAKRKRTLSHPEIKAIWDATYRLDGSRHQRNFGRLVRFALLTAQRRGECATLKFGDILDATWRQDENKSGRPHRLKLPPMAMTIVGQGDPRQFCFEGDPGKSISGWSKMKKLLDEKSGVVGWRLHDLRRTAVTEMQNFGVAQDVTEAIMNHAIAGVGSAYLRGEAQNEKNAALAKWADQMQSIVGFNPLTLNKNEV